MIRRLPSLFSKGPSTPKLVPLPPLHLRVRRTHPERFYSFWALALHGLAFVGLVPVSTWYIALATGAGSILHSCTWNRRYYHFGYDFLLHWSPFLWVRPDWDGKGLAFFVITLVLYVVYHGGVEVVLSYYRDAKGAYIEEDYLVRRALAAIPSYDDLEDAVTGQSSDPLWLQVQGEEEPASVGRGVAPGEDGPA